MGKERVNVVIEATLSLESILVMALQKSMV